MRIFEEGNWTTDKCPVCGTDKEGPVVLISIKGTNEGYISEARQVHLNCLELIYDPKRGIIYQGAIR